MAEEMQFFIRKVVQNIDLTRFEAEQAMRFIMSGAATGAQIGSLITALRMKGETVDEITGCAVTMRSLSQKIRSKHALTVDTCGTGGDGSGTYNISTMAAFVAAGTGTAIAKHGNKSVSSLCGSADLLSELGVNTNASADIVERCLNEIGIAFMFAPLFHPAMKYAGGPRKEIGIRTIFNLLGPLTNPANAGAQLIGVYSRNLTEPIANVLLNLGAKRAFVVHGEDGLDEITTAAGTFVSEVKDGGVSTYLIEPEEFGIKRADKKAFIGGDLKANAGMAKRVLDGERGALRDIVLLNAAFAVTAGGKARDVAEGLRLAELSLDSGAAMEKLQKLVELTNKVNE